MSEERFTDESLREALARIARVAGDGSACPPPERLHLSARGELPPPENHELVEHLAGCTACGAAWRLARDLASDAGGEAVSDRRSEGRLLRPSVWRRAAPFAAAAALILVAGLGIRYLTGPDTQPEVYRAEMEDWLRPLGDSDAPLAREACLLRWTPGPEGTSYHVRVTDEDLRLLAVGKRLESAEFLVPAEALEELAEGASFYWQVSASLPDGRRLDSETFVSTVD